MTDTTNTSAKPPLRIALAGLGTVGAGVIRLMEANADLIARRAGRPVAVSYTHLDVYKRQVVRSPLR